MDDSDGIGPDGIGDMKINHAMGAGISNSCASYHGQPVRLSWQWWRRCCPESRDAPHLFGPGLKERLAYEIAGDLRTARSFVLAKAKMIGSSGQRDRYSAKEIVLGSIQRIPQG